MIAQVARSLRELHGKVDELHGKVDDGRFLQDTERWACLPQQACNKVTRILISDGIQVICVGLPGQGTSAGVQALNVLH